MMSKIQQLRNQLEREKGRKAQIEGQICDAEQNISRNKKSLRRHEYARELIREFGLKIQQQLQYHISSITSLALDAVFDNPYKLVVEFTERRNKTECDVYFEREGNRIDPLSACGLGTADVAAFALRVSSWSMQTPRSHPVLILDEPFKCLKGKDANMRVLDMIKEISDKLKLQIIMISDERVDREDIIGKADRVFEVKIRNGVSSVNQIN